MVSLNAVFTVLLVLFYGISSTAFCQSEELNPNPDLKRIKAYLHKQPKIRVLIPSTTNLGHQMSSLHVMRQLRELGFKGVFELTVETSSDVQKLKTLLPDFTGDLNSEFTSQSYGRVQIHVGLLDKNEVERVGLTVTGGWDATIGTTYTTINSDYFICVQPLYWNHPSYAFIGDKFHSLNHLIKLPMKTFPVVEADIETFFHTSLSTQPHLRGKAEGLREIFRRQNQFELGPMYGLQMANNATATMGTYAKSILAAVEAGLITKPVLVPVFSQHGNYFGLDKFPAQLLDVNDPQIAEKLNRLKPGDVAFVDVGFVTPDVFSYVYSQQTLPGVLEGQNAKSLLQELGLPYMNLRGDFIELTTLHGVNQDPEALRKISEAHSLFNGKVEWNKQMKPEQKALIVDFIRDTRNPESAVSKLYASYARHNQNLKYNKIVQALDIVLEKSCEATMTATTQGVQQ